MSQAFDLLKPYSYDPTADYPPSVADLRMSIEEILATLAGRSDRDVARNEQTREQVIRSLIEVESDPCADADMRAAIRSSVILLQQIGD
ncbi:hypothetical protein [Rudaeicoccus suwonensis]|uniref:hypothetical protein n=1 Tax=Rudaeicoccus suwonensis TaxID=657409 RepID=UPI00119CBA5C|nr:hypothetical protein [Rudaeicoccus suwonensis]